MWEPFGGSLPTEGRKQEEKSEKNNHSEDECLGPQRGVDPRVDSREATAENEGTIQT